MKKQKSENEPDYDVVKRKIHSGSQKSEIKWNANDIEEM